MCGVRAAPARPAIGRRDNRRAPVKTVLVGDAHQLSPVKARRGMFAQTGAMKPHSWWLSGSAGSNNTSVDNRIGAWTTASTSNTKLRPEERQARAARSRPSEWVRHGSTLTCGT